MNRHLPFYYIIILTIFISCENQETLPQNNNVSYLDSTKILIENQNLNNTTSKQETISLDCPKIHRELLGNIYQKNIRIKNTNDYKTYLTLTLNTPFTLDCENNQKIKVDQVELFLSPEMNIDQYLGSSVLVVGEISKNDDVIYPVKIEVLRIEPIKGTIQ